MFAERELGPLMIGEHVYPIRVAVILVHDDPALATRIKLPEVFAVVETQQPLTVAPEPFIQNVPETV